MAQKLVLVVVDSLKSETLDGAIAAEVAPTFAKLVERGTLVRDCVSTFPSVTPCATSEISTGVGPDGHWIPGMNWYHRVERRYVEYGTSLEATRAFGLFRCLYDTVYNMNMAHLSHEVETVFERLMDAGVRTAVTPFLIYRGRRRHELGLEGLLRRVAVAANFHHAVWGPDELFYGELYASRRVPCRPTLARPGTRDEYSACVGRELVEKDLFDFLLFSLPDHDFHSHRLGPDETLDSIAHADASLEQIVAAGGGMDAFLEEHAVIVMSDHAQTKVEHPLDVIAALSEDWRVQLPNMERPESSELAVSPTSRAANVYVLGEGRRRARAHAAARHTLESLDGIDLVAWLANGDGEPAERLGAGPPQGAELEAVVERAGARLRFRPGSEVADWRGNRWDLDGDYTALAGELRGGRFESGEYPNALERLWSALAAPQSGDITASLSPGYECVDWGGATHVGGGSHGSLHAGDSLGPLLMVGVEPGPGAPREQWTLRDIYGVVLDHFGVPVEPEPVAVG
ncbi:MAG TPA: alkaline phosphatase family protein [Solirubrobacterales bacterium]|nr:alkaline phosphatase family protein [Solirubrobacterales bacterium]